MGRDLWPGGEIRAEDDGGGEVGRGRVRGDRAIKEGTEAWGWGEACKICI
jgi:hypothetical protein